MKKSIGIICGLTVISACTTLGMTKEEQKKVTGPRTAPMYNSSIGASGAPNVPPMPPEPPSVMANNGNNGFIALPPGPSVTTSSNASAIGSSLPNERRAPQFNREALGHSGDVIAQVPPVATMQAPVPPIPPTMPQDSLIPPPPVVAAKPVEVASVPVKPAPIIPPAPVPEPHMAKPEMKSDYPKLAEIPPAPAAPIPASADPRVQEMKKELANMENGQKPAEQKVIVKSVASGNVNAPLVETKLASNEEPGALRLPPAFANKGAAPVAPMAPVPPAPPADMAASVVAPAPMSATAPVTVAQSSNPGVMPIGPTVVVHSNKTGGVRPPVAPSAPAPVGFAAMPSPDAPVAAPAPVVASTSLQPASTSVSSLKPIAPASSTLGGSLPVASNDAGSFGMASTSASSLKPIASSNHRVLPESRYAKYRRAARDNNASHSSN